MLKIPGLEATGYDHPFVEPASSVKSSHHIAKQSSNHSLLIGPSMQPDSSSKILSKDSSLTTLNRQSDLRTPAMKSMNF